MSSISYARHQLPPAVIQHALRLYLRFTLSYRDVEEVLAERGVDVSYETVRRWVLKFAAPRSTVCWTVEAGRVLQHLVVRRPTRKTAAAKALRGDAGAP
jgi:hypothetical protein